MIRTYSDLSCLETFEERFEYLKLSGAVGDETFGFYRILNQKFYKSYEWKHSRDLVIFRDCGCDLGVDGFDIFGTIIVHHMNPITMYDIEHDPDKILNPEYLITTTITTHNAIHYGDKETLPKPLIERSANDTCPWKKK